MEWRKKELCELLDKLGIPYRVVEHPPVYTIEDMVQQGLPQMECVAKNLFLRNANGKQHYLVTMPHEKPVDMKELAGKIGSTRLSFGSEERLWNNLKLKRGAVTPLGLFNNEDHAVVLILDEDLKAREEIAVHPNENTATLYLPLSGLERVLQETGNPVRWVQL